jgi:hypothetical protein
LFALSAPDTTTDTIFVMKRRTGGEEEEEENSFHKDLLPEELLMKQKAHDKNCPPDSFALMRETKKKNTQSLDTLLQPFYLFTYLLNYLFNNNIFLQG